MQGTKRQVVICDIDGTVADLSHRLHWGDKEIRVGDIVKIKRVNTKCIVKSVQSDGAFLEDLKDSTGEWLWSFSDIKKVKRWDKFFETIDQDKPIVNNIKVVQTLAMVYPVIFMSGRDIDYILPTVAWLRKHRLDGLDWATGQYKVPTTTIHMRPSKDQRPDYIIKEELYRKHIEPYYDVVVWIDDRQQVVDMVRNTLKLNCWQVCDGKY